MIDRCERMYGIGRLRYQAIVSLFSYCCYFASVLANMKEVKDYCQSEQFIARCSYDEVVVMETAIYGRMSLGRCVRYDMGYLGCKSDVIDITDDKCSGRKSCEISIVDVMFEKTQPCFDLKSYLLASYSCLKVLTVEVKECRNSKFVHAYPPSGRIASVTTQDTWCGTRDIPWLIEAVPGMRINITMTDFHAGRQPFLSPSTARYHPSMLLKEQQAPSVAPAACHKYATVIEPGTSLTPERTTVVCGRRTRWQQVFVSEGSVVQIQIESRRGGNSDYFILNYETFGCPNPPISENAWITREKNEVKIGCKLTNQRWRLICVNDEWTGEYGNCTELAAYEILGQSTSSEGRTSRTAVVVVCVCAFLISLVAVLVVVIGCKRHRHRLAMRAASERAAGSYGKSVGKLGEEVEYVHPSRDHTYGRSKRHHHHHHHHHGGGGDHGFEEGEIEFEGSGCGAIDVDGSCAMNYEKVGSFNKGLVAGKHIWEMPLPIPGES